MRYVTGFRIVHRYAYGLIPTDECDPVVAVHPREARWVGDIRDYQVEVRAGRPAGRVDRRAGPRPGLEEARRVRPRLHHVRARLPARSPPAAWSWWASTRSSTWRAWSRARPRSRACGPRSRLNADGVWAVVERVRARRHDRGRPHGRGRALLRRRRSRPLDDGHGAARRRRQRAPRVQLPPHRPADRARRDAALLARDRGAAAATGSRSRGRSARRRPSAQTARDARGLRASTSRPRAGCMRAGQHRARRARRRRRAVPRAAASGSAT